MTTSIVPVPLSPSSPGPTQAIAPAELLALSTEALRAELAQQMQATAQHLLRLAWIVRILEDRGEDLSGLMVPLLDYLRRIAYGQVLPEVVVRFADQPLLLAAVASLPIPDQRPFAEGQPLRLVVPVPEAQGGGWTHRLVPPARLGKAGVSQAFDRGRLRSEGEQKEWLLAQASRSATRGQRHVQRGKARADRSTGEIVVGRSRAPLADVLAAAADLKGPAEEGDRTEACVVLLTEGEHRRLETRAAEGGTTMAELGQSWPTSPRRGE